ncbi:MAG: DUF5103 domain-containing protein [Bacteroidetes bacterium]|nr:DUF5103 domain-containing protein [Bacteroidota bacterium]HET6245961.1 DUF5103 domain-containing protein [Bacteroidia bacterium]
MKNKTKPLIIYLVLLKLVLFFQSSLLIAQENKPKHQEEKELIQDDYYRTDFLRHENHVYISSIKTVLLTLNEDELAPAVIKLNSSNVLKLSFDILDLELRNYMYAFIHCDAMWEPSPLHEAEYLDGFFENYITDFQFSFNTLERYIHYNLLFPNDNINFTTSGNYVLVVYEEGNRDKPVITRRFMVYEEKVIVNPNVVRAAIPEERTTKQKVDFTILHSGYTILNPNLDLRVAVLQNNRWDNAKTELKPLFIREGELVYNYDRENLFHGGNEFRNFDIKTLRFKTENVKEILFKDNQNHVILTDDLILSTARYSTQPDINGRFVIRIQEGWNSDLEADYSYVHFRLKYPTPVIDGNLYIFGALSDWTFQNDYKLKYDFESKTYHATLYLKQGYYNYSYSFLQDGTSTGNPQLIDGSYFETENEYTIFVYHREPSTNHFKIIGYKHFNSRGPF